MKMKDKLDSPKPLKKHKLKVKKGNAKKKQAKVKAKQSLKIREKKKAVMKQAISAPSPIASDVLSTDTGAPTERVTPIEPSSADMREVTDNAQVISSDVATHRVSKNVTSMDKAKQKEAIHRIIKGLLMNEMTQGEALRELRVNVLGLRQQDYVALTGVSRKTVSEIENDKGNYTADIFNKVFKPFDLKVSLVPTSGALLTEIMSTS
ncbi:helix-turn-helix domain-containing protein [Marinomonas sp.]|nr:helix-turn-helix transcriptional regulator [Marinomonas sp.]MDB4837205.1 helix-turn-helix domain-containing protein [Marinomonas sp.]